LKTKPTYDRGRYFKRLIRLDWDVIAGIIAALTALILHFLHIIEIGLLLAITVVLLAILLIRDLRRELHAEHIITSSERTEATVKDILSALKPSDVTLIGPSGLLFESKQFAHRGQGEVTWFNVCLLMFRPQATFDALLRPFIENPLITSIQFISDQSVKELWQSEVISKAMACPGCEKIKEPIWCSLEENVSFIFLETTPDGRGEALLSFWGEPFMSKSAGRDIPRYIFHVKEHSELITRLRELERAYRIHT
jgi:hypothetical protein